MSNNCYENFYFLLVSRNLSFAGLSSSRKLPQLLLSCYVCRSQLEQCLLFWLWARLAVLQVILFEIDCAIFYTTLHELFCQFISWTNWVNSGKFMDNCWISCRVMAGMNKVYDHLTIIKLYKLLFFHPLFLNSHNTIRTLFSFSILNFIFLWEHSQSMLTRFWLFMITYPTPLPF